MTPEQMQKIVDDAPGWARWWCKDKSQFLDVLPCSKCVAIESLRTQLAQHDTLDLEPADIPHGCIVLER